MPVADDLATSTPPQPGYAGFIAGLALFLLLLVAFTQQPTQYVARSVIHQQAVGSKAMFVPELPLRVDEAAAVARGVLPTTPGPAGVALPLVQVVSLPVTDGSAELAVECRAANAAEALRYCTDAASNIVQAQPVEWSPGAAKRRAQQSELQARLALARESEHALLGEGSRLEQEQIALAWREMQLARVAAEAAAPAARRTASPWSERLAQRMLERQELLRSKTEAHPLVQQIEEQIAELQALVEREAVEQPVTDQQPTAAATDLAAAQAELARKFQALADSRTALRGRVEQMEADLARLAQVEPPLTLRTVLREPPTLLSSAGQAISWTRLCLLACIASAGGFAVAVAVRHQARQHAFSSGDEVGRLLAMPVLSGGGPHSLLQTSRGRLEERLRSGILIAELVAFVLALTLTWSLATENELATPRVMSPSATTAAIPAQHQRR